ncbi:chemosensory receptor B [Elysia marginata]|uniref:Chemosensory receptor B n=1 Tax=Elysia marginata TaxID=1093978 RepID=A0AAV4F3R5_9GAST|nr:chemosensory receptor B [Elysia marginata]
MYNSTENTKADGFLNDGSLRILGVLFKLVLNPALAAAGICSNCINVLVFLRIGLSDGVTQNFFILSLSDGLCCVIASVNSIAYILQQTVPPTTGLGAVELLIQRVYWACFFAVTFPMNISIVTTVVIAVVRCCCVAMPFRVKYLLTASRQLVAILVSSGAVVGVLLYVFTPMRTVYLRNPETNRLYAVLVGYRWATYTAFTSVTLYSSFTIVIGCVVILSASLKKSFKFRESSSGSSVGSESDKGRDMRVVKTVVFVSVAFICCFLPHLTFTLLKVFMAEFSPQGRFKNENQLFLMMNEACLLISANMNIFIYLLCNTRYRTAFRAVVGKTHTES